MRRRTRLALPLGLGLLVRAAAASGSDAVQVTQSEAIRKETRSAHAEFVRAVAQARELKNCLLFEEQRACVVVDDASAVKGVGYGANYERLIYAAPYRAYSPFNALGRNKRWPPRERDVRPMCGIQPNAPAEPEKVVFAHPFAPQFLEAPKSYLAQVPAPARSAPLPHGLGTGSTLPLDISALFRSKPEIASKFDAPLNALGSGRARLLVPISKVEDGEYATRFWQYWVDHRPACNDLSCPLVYRDTPVSISYCRAASVGGELGPGRSCRRVVVDMPSGSWVEAFTGPHGGGGCGFGEDDFMCHFSELVELRGDAASREAVEKAQRTLVARLRNTLERPPLALRTRSSKSRIVGLGKMRSSPVLNRRFEHVSVEVSGIDSWELSVSVTVLVSRQNSSHRADYRPANDAEQEQYVRVVQSLLKQAGCQ